MGRGKVEVKRIEREPNEGQISFCKRRKGLMKKATELSILCDAEVALLLFPSSGKSYHFASRDIHSTICKYRCQVALPHSNIYTFRSLESWRSEIDELRRSVGSLKQSLKHLAGEDLTGLGMRELKQLERQLKTGVERIVSQKRCLNAENMKTLKTRVRELQENACLDKRIMPPAVSKLRQYGQPSDAFARVCVCREISFKSVVFSPDIRRKDDSSAIKLSRKDQQLVL